MLHFLLVDDEPGHVLGFTGLLGKLRPNDRVSSARNGEEALYLCANQSFDLIFTDIQMPQMNGLELMEKLDPLVRSKVVVLSGYDFFEYAQKALTFGAFGYLLKPVDVGKLQEVLHRAEQTSERERGERKRQQELAARISRMEPAYSERLLQAWVEGTLSPERLSELEAILPFTGAGTAVCARRKTPFSREEVQQIQARLQSCGDSLCFSFGHGDEELICLLGAGIDAASAGRIFAEMTQQPAFETLVAGIGDRHDSLLQEAYLSVSEARLALAEQFYHEDQIVFYFTSCGLDCEALPVLTTAAESQLKETIRNGDEVAAAESLASIFREWRKRPYPLPRRVRDKCRLLLTKAIEDHELLREGSQHDEWLREIEAFTEHETVLSTLASAAHDVLRRAVHAVREWKDNRRHQLVQRCLAYIDEHYAYDISLESTAERFGLSPGYFSQYFKNKLHINFTVYLNQVRLTKAKAMLEHEDLRVYQIAQAAGYQDAKYFNRVFKREVGMTPEEYRKTIRLLERKRG